MRTSCWPDILLKRVRSHKNKAGNGLIQALAFSCILTFFSLLFSSLTLGTRMHYDRNKMAHWSHSGRFAPLFLQLSPTGALPLQNSSEAVQFTVWKDRKDFYPLVCPVARPWNYNQESFLKLSFLAFGLSRVPVRLVAHRLYKPQTSCEPRACANKITQRAWI